MEFDLLLNLLADIEEASIANLTGTVENLTSPGSQINLGVNWGDSSSLETLIIVDGGSGDTDGTENGSISFSIPHTYEEDGTFTINVFAEQPNFQNFDSDSINLVVNPIDPPSNSDPIAVNDSATTPQDQPINIDVLANDSDPDTDDILAITESSQPANGTVELESASQIFIYTPNTGYTGTDSFTYTIGIVFKSTIIIDS